MTAPETPSAPRRRLRYILITLAAFALTVALFYAEEDWRGWRAMQQCKQELEAQGVSLDWAKRIPAPVPKNENVFGVPEMQKWFVKNDTNSRPGRIGSPGSNELTAKFYNPAWDNPARMVVASLTIGLPGANPPPGSIVFQWGNAQARSEMGRLIDNAIGPVAFDPSGLYYTKRQPEEIRAVQIFVQCRTEPKLNDLENFIPKPLVPDEGSAHEGYEAVRVEPTGTGCYNVTMRTPGTVVEFLKLNEKLEPVFGLIRNALQRPDARMDGDYASGPSEMPIPNFVGMRTIAQRLAAMAECHLLLGRPDEALHDLTLMHDICRRLLQENKPMTLVSAMINVAIRGLYASTIADGIRIRAWREPQLAALQEQLKQINLLGPVQQAFGEERFSLCYHLSTETPVQFFTHTLREGGSSGSKTTTWAAFTDSMENWIRPRLIPRGWVWQNMVTGAHYYTNLDVSMDPERQIVFPDKADAVGEQLHAVFSHWSPYSFLADFCIPNFARAFLTTARNQTEVKQALLACALERYRLAHGEYPENLDALVPQFADAIPHDIIGGKPPHYRRNSDGTFLLYSIGWDEKDHGGQGGKDYMSGDWVWPEK